MARKSITVTADDRGTLKTFIFTEMGALEAQRFIMKAVKLLLGTGIISGGSALPGGADGASGTLEGIGRSVTESLLHGDGLARLASFDDELAQSLIGDLLACYEYTAEGVKIRLSTDNAGCYIEDVRTLFELERTAVREQFGFLSAAAPSASPEPDGRRSAHRAAPPMPAPKISPRSSAR